MKTLIRYKTVIGRFFIVLALAGAFFSAGLTRGAPELAQPETPQETAVVTPEPSREPLDTLLIEDLVNEYRVENGLHPLEHDPQLCVTAKIKADDMVENDYWGHVGLDGRKVGDLFQEYTTGYKVASENIQFGHYVEEKYALEYWMNSPEHNQAMLDVRFDKTCIQATEYAAKEYQDYVRDGYVVVQHFGDLL